MQQVGIHMYLESKNVRKWVSSNRTAVCLCTCASRTIERDEFCCIEPMLHALRLYTIPTRRRSLIRHLQYNWASTTG